MDRSRYVIDHSGARDAAMAQSRPGRKKTVRVSRRARAGGKTRNAGEPCFAAKWTGSVVARSSSSRTAPGAGSTGARTSAAHAGAHDGSIRFSSATRA